ncbi:DNA ligase D [Kribbella sp. VKM Ac-2571]|uniref:non-homologous end-joining DNA ligase n=1 Tax=Kribbella sp. VKM Ac-2571 TaxID=2512222 RepID=UPI00105C1857|nr:non-homologous end-joining DNA ligase [Kribbella sp. VKM Ac-2571]TDO52944.1 DNA ligase D [Kribbella sp. VKM Ac-2571]
MLATLTEERFSDPAWIYERKLDGVRCLVHRTGDRVSLYSRNHHELNNSYPELVDALTAQQGDFVLDGEIVAFAGHVTSFARLQQRMQVKDPEAARRSNVAVYLYLFDVLRQNDRDLTGLELRERKAVLRKLLTYADPLRYTAHRNRDGVAYWEHACRQGWEGVIAKRADSTYAHGRSKDWLKFKCVTAQEFVIGGFTDPQGSRSGFGALLVGYYESGELRYAGKVGTGYDQHTLDELGRELVALEQDEPAFAKGNLPRSRVHWVKPRLVGQIAFSEWTRDGRLRHPRFQGLRDDKSAHEVIRERAR